MKYRLLCIISFISFLGCEDEDPKITQVAEGFLNEVLDIMEAHSIHKNTIDWADFRSKVFEKASNAQTVTDTHPALLEALKMLGDNHSHFVPPGGGNYLFASNLSCSAGNTTKPQMPIDVGYVNVTYYTGSSTNNEAMAFSNEIQEQISSQDSEDIIGWIVDLRGNTGGNMWPMIAGIGPILGEGTAGYFIDPDGGEVSWGFEDGASMNEDFIVTQVANSYELINPNPKVAVLLDNAVSSSGEVVAISFIGRENTRSFGSPTCGLSTANRQFNLSYDYLLRLTVSYLADRNKNTFGVPIVPDQASSNATIVQDAINWIRE